MVQLHHLFWINFHRFSDSLPGYGFYQRISLTGMVGGTQPLSTSSPPVESNCKDPLLENGKPENSTFKV